MKRVVRARRRRCGRRLHCLCLATDAFGHRAYLAFWRDPVRLCVALAFARRVAYDADLSPLLRCRRLDA